VRNYQVEVRIPIPILLSSTKETSEPEAMFRFLNDLMTDVSIEIQAQVQTIIQSIHKRANESGFDVRVPNLAIPMGVGYSISDVTGQVGRRWTEKE
jgi:hypothetical protein